MNGPRFSAAKKLKVTWSAPAAAFPEQKNLYKHMRTTRRRRARTT